MVYAKKNAFFLLIGLLGLPILADCQAVITISNPTDFKRVEEVVSVPWEKVLSVYPDIDTSHLIVVNPITKRQAPYQLEHLGGAKIRNILIQVSVLANGKLILEIRKGQPLTFPVKTYCRYVPERKDDFAWENDKIAFRSYGKALENTDENAYGMDVWVKRTDKMVLDKRYQSGGYHNDHGDGLDYYHVGFSLGAGDIAPFTEDSIWYSKNYRRWKILDNGPLRSTFQLEYDSWDVDTTKVSVIKTMSIDAGSQLHKVEALYSFSGRPSIPVVVGISKRQEAGIELFDEQNGCMGYWEPKDAKNGTTGVGCIFAGSLQNVLIEKGQLLSVTQALPGKAVIYYRGAAWDKAGAVTSAKDWFDYLKQYRQKITHPLQLDVRKSS